MKEAIYACTSSPDGFVVGPEFSTLRGLMSSTIDYCLPAPGGCLARDVIRDADLYVAEVARLAVKFGRSGKNVTDLLWRKMEQVSNQSHYGADDDVLIIARFGAWAAEFSN